MVWGGVGGSWGNPRVTEGVASLSQRNRDARGGSRRGKRVKNGGSRISVHRVSRIRGRVQMKEGLSDEQGCASCAGGR